jgi:hypothetical protein
MFRQQFLVAQKLEFSQSIPPHPEQLLLWLLYPISKRLIGSKRVTHLKNQHRLWQPI